MTLAELGLSGTTEARESEGKKACWGAGRVPAISWGFWGDWVRVEEELGLCVHISIGKHAFGCGDAQTHTPKYNVFRKMYVLIPSQLHFVYFGQPSLLILTLMTLT